MAPLSSSAAITVQTKGINWDQLSAQVTVATAVIGVLVFFLRLAWQAWAKGIGVRLDKQDENIKAIIDDAKEARSAANVTAMSTARMEGYMAKSNGMGKILPAVSPLGQLVADDSTDLSEGTRE